MTGSRQSTTIMRPNHCWTILRVSIFAALLLTLKADGEDSDCGIEIRVRRNTVYEVSVGENLQINCTVQFCNSSPPKVSWDKFTNVTNVRVNVSGSHIKTQWKRSKDREGISQLVFRNILKNDSGLYRCDTGDQVSHYIKVSVNDGDKNNNVTQQPVTTGTVTPNGQSKEDPWMYIWTAAGIVTFVVIVIIISVASMHGCKGNSKKDTQTENQYMAIPMIEQPFPDDTRGSPSVPPPRRSTRRKSPSSQPRELPLPRDNQHVYGEVLKGRGPQDDSVVEEGSSLVYAALNHQPLAGAAARPRKPMEETSEYAAIRVKDATPTTH